MQLRLFRILWGPTLETVLDFVTPVAGDSPRIWRQPRKGSERLDAGAATDALITGRDYYLSVVAKWFDLAHQTGATGLQAFIDWANDGNPFTLVPSTELPTLTVPGCFLEAPVIDPSWSAENDATMTVELVIRHPTQDLGLAWRGLFFEYVAGQSLTDPSGATYSRSSVGYEITPGGYLLSHVADNVCDGHYPDRVAGLQTTLIEQAVTNDIVGPEDLTAAAWDKTTNVSITANNARAPDQALSADLVVENVAVGVLHAIFSTPGYAIASGDVVTGLCFVRDGGRFRGQVYFCDATNTNRVGISYNLLTGTIASSVGGAGVLTASRITPLAGGWYMLWWRGTINAGVVSIRFQMDLFDASGSNSYTGDGASGTYLWGVTAVHTAAKVVASYTPTTSAKDTLNYAYSIVPQAGWWYVKYVEGGGFYTSSVFSRLFELGVSEFASPSLGLVYGANITFKSATGATVGSNVAASAIGDTVEMLVILYSDASVELRQSINGGAETTGGRSTVPAGGMPSSWGAAKLGIGDNPTGTGGRASATQMATIRHGPFVATGPQAVTTIAQARNV